MRYNEKEIYKIIDGIKSKYNDSIFHDIARMMELHLEDHWHESVEESEV